MSNETEKVFAEVERLAEEFQLKAHLASMDARTKWEEELRPRLKKLEQQFDKSVEEAKLSDEVNKLETRLRSLVEGITDSTGQTEG